MRLNEPSSEASHDGLPDFDVSVEFRMDCGIWSCAPNPFLSPEAESALYSAPRFTGNQSFNFSSGLLPVPSSKIQFAIGTDHTIDVFSEDQSRWAKTASQEDHFSSPPLSLEWLGPQVVASGHRNRCIRLWDLRANKSVTRFTLVGSQPVKGLKRIDENRLFAHGGRGRAAVYDLRWDRETNVSIRQQQNEGRPVVQYCYPNDTGLPVGFDVNVELGLVATGEEDGDVTLWELGTGKVARRLPPGPWSVQTKKGVRPAYVRCLKWAQVNQGDWVLFTASKDEIANWSW